MGINNAIICLRACLIGLGSRRLLSPERLLVNPRSQRERKWDCSLPVRAVLGVLRGCRVRT